MMKCISFIVAAAIIALVHSQPIPSEITKLAAYNVNIHDTSISGLSAGGFFAVQMHMAFSDIMRGSGIFAGGPYHCAQGSQFTATGPCMQGSGLNPNKYIKDTDANAAAGLIADPAKYLTPSNQTIYLWGGTKDITVHPPVMKALYQYYSHYVDTKRIIFENTMPAAHTQPSDDAALLNPCDKSQPPYLSNCHFDGAGKALQQIYGKLSPRNEGTLTGKFYKVDQKEFIKDTKANSMEEFGILYVPAACDKGAQCVLHISYHGCEQNWATLLPHDAYVRYAGYNKWADTNNIIVLYPQTIKSYGMPGTPFNPKGCWDWWGYCGNPTTYDTTKGSQMAAMRDMISRISSGYRPLPTPSGLRVVSVTDNSVTLSWIASEKAVGYDIKQDDVKINPSLITGTTYTVTGLQSGSDYSFTVNSEDGSGGVSGDSDEVIAHTSGPAPPLSPPKDLTIHDTFSTSISLAWTVVKGATGYNVYRNGTKVTSSPVVNAAYVDTGLQPSTVYSYTATAVGSSGESGQSTPVVGRTKTAWNCTTVTESNYNHVAHGRAHQSGGFVFANGSNDGMGLYNVFTTSTLSQTSQNFWIVGQCPPQRFW